MSELHVHLGKIGKQLPELTIKEWETVFQFIDNFLIVEFDGKSTTLIEADWKKLREALEILGKVKV